MLRFAKSGEISAARRQMKERFEVAHGRRHVRRNFSTRGGLEPDMDTYWLPRERLWALFFPNYFDDTRRWGLWFGTELKSEREIHNPSIEINLDLDQEDISVAGRMLVDRQGRFYLAHKGGLGGGHGSQMAIEEFVSRIRGHARTAVTLPNGKEQLVFIIGGLHEGNFLRQLQSYVSECERLRVIARRLNAAGHRRPALPERGLGHFMPENDADGLGLGGHVTRQQIRRLHGRVVNALAARLHRPANNKDPYGTKPDLFLQNRARQMRLLFEVKISSSPQSMYTAIGQLLVYGADQPVPPRRVLVCPTRPTHPGICEILRQQHISVVTFSGTTGQNIAFHGLEEVL